MEQGNDQMSMTDILENLQQSQTTLDNMSAQSTSSTLQNTKLDSIWTPDLALHMSYLILIFGAFVIIIMAILVWRAKDIDTRGILRLFSVPLIAVSAVFLVVAGYGEKQIAPVIGLLGTMAGYLLGSSNGKRQPPPSPEPNKKAPAD